MEKNKSLALTNDSITSFFIVTGGSCQPITSTEKTEMTLLAELKEMLYRRFRQVKNCIKWC
jgi:hypothetical protein